MNEFSVGVTHLVSQQGADAELEKISIDNYPELKILKPLGLLVEENINKMQLKNLSLQMKLFETTSKQNFPIQPAPPKKKMGGFRFSMTQQLHSKNKEHLMTGMLSTKLMTGFVPNQSETILRNNDWKMAALEAFMNNKLEYIKREGAMVIKGKAIA
jgi:hypothetical protein